MSATLRPAAGAAAPPRPPAPPARTAADEACEYCGADQLAWRKCKQICGNCGQINRSCADL